MPGNSPGSQAAACDRPLGPAVRPTRGPLCLAPVPSAATECPGVAGAFSTTPMRMTTGFGTLGVAALEWGRPVLNLVTDFLVVLPFNVGRGVCPLIAVRLLEPACDLGYVHILSLCNRIQAL